GGPDRIALFMVPELIQDGVAWITASRTGVRSQRDDARAVRKRDALLDRLILAQLVEEILILVEIDGTLHQLQQCVARLDKLDGLRLRSTEDCPGRVRMLDAIEHSFQRGRKR